MSLQLFNTESRSLEEFKPINKGKAGLYCCGPTVYNYAHIGNLRAYMFEDILRRTLEMAGYDVDHVMNVTDVGHLTSDGDDGEDKMIKGAREKGMSVWDIADFFTEAFFKDSEALNIKRPTTVCRATEHIQEMIDIISLIEKNGYAYQAGGNVYFDTSRLSDYGRLAGLNLEDLKAGARVAVDTQKKNPTDFVLWFTNSKFDNQAMVWDSPWGKGYPGWHVECSAMSSKYLGEQFDIHCGGIDHVPVHHTNEIAQSEAAFGKKWVNYWLHNEFLLMKDGKMSKSKGSFITLQSLIEEGYNALDYRYFLLGAHYRTQLVFSKESLDGAKNSRKKLNNRIKELFKNTQPATEITDKALEHLEKFRSFLLNDLNTPRGIAQLWDLLKDGDISADQKLAAALEMDTVLGFSLADLAREEAEVSVDLEESIMKLIEERIQARKNKDWARSDEIRDELLEQGIVLKDTPQGTTWEKS